MKILVTGSSGFVGSNLVLRLRSLDHEVFTFDKNNTKEELNKFIEESDFIFHLAGVNRPTGNEAFKDNSSLTDDVINGVKSSGKKTPILITSSIQAKLDNEYGKSKKEAEDLLLKFQEENKNPVYIFRCPNLFGKWCRPNYNSVIATFCYNVAHDLPIQINESAPKIPFLYIDDLIDKMLEYLCKNQLFKGLIEDFITYEATPKEVAELLYKFKKGRSDRFLAKQSGFEKKLYATYLSYLEPNDFKYDLEMHEDNRGSFTELYKSEESGQTSVNIIHPGITKGNHYHNSKNEKYIVVKGSCVTKFRKVGTSEVISYVTSGDKLEVIDIPTGYTHSISNIGKEDAVVVMWASEPFDPDKPDTYFEVVE